MENLPINLVSRNVRTGALSRLIVRAQRIDALKLHNGYVIFLPRKAGFRID